MPQLNMQEPNMLSPYGTIVAPSTSTTLLVTAYQDHTGTPIIGQTVYTDQQLNDGYLYRSVGSVTDVTTQNPRMSGGNAIISAVARSHDESSNVENLVGTDSKIFEMKVQATYKRRNGASNWQQVGTGLLSSPKTNTPVYIMTEQVLADILASVIAECSYVGTHRGMTDVKMPMRLLGFNTKRGATHQAVVGRSGSGKTALSTQIFGAQMRNESHAQIVIDPQGQWSNEHGFLWSLQAFAHKLGREVTVLRVSEDIRLPLSIELLAAILDELKLWRSLQRMGGENAQALSEEVAKLVVYFMSKRVNRDMEPSVLPNATLRYALKSIAEDPDIMARIYARTGEAGASLRDVLASMTGAEILDEDGVAQYPSPESLERGAVVFENVLAKFTPLINLFMKTNLNGTPRLSLGGRRGFLTNVLRARDSGEIAPYVILDMSSDVSLQAQVEYARSLQNNASRIPVGDDDDDDEDYFAVDPQANMRQMLDNPDIKARIVSTVLDTVVRQAETAFSNGARSLDTQIIFDEAWRYAPNPNTVPRESAIYGLSSRLAGYALDTRKYGVGWTYILQSPSDLNPTIWKQLTYVWSGYGMMSADKRMIGDLLDDASQLRLYDQFSDPSATNVYPFMVTGPVNPLIFTAAPSFFNAFSDANEFLTANSAWIDDICHHRSQPVFTHLPDSISLESNRRRLLTSTPSPSAPRRANAAPDRGIGAQGVPSQSAGSVDLPPF